MVIIMKNIVKKTILVSLSLLSTSCIPPIDLLGGLFEETTSSSITQNTIEVGSSNLSKYKDYAGEKDIESDMVAISDQYKLTISKKDLLANKEVKLSIPVNKNFIPEDFSDAQIQVESLNTKTGEWVADGTFAYYDKDSSKVFFSSSLSKFITPSNTLTTASFKTKASEDEIEVVYRIRVYLFSDMVSATRDGSNFTIHYYPSSLTSNSSKVKKDSEWDGSGSYGASDIPNFVEDLDKALNDAYNKLLSLKNSSGSVFSKLSTPIDVYIANTGGDAGNSPLGGPMKISNTKISTYQDLKETVAHEMVHVFQGQYYKISGLFSGRYNRWFIEAVANYYAAVATDLNDAQKKDFYGDFYSDYLSIGLQSSNDNSMYATAHFLDWLSTKYSSTIVGDALAKSNGNDMIGLSEAIKSSGESGGIGTAYEEYTKYLISNPEGYAGFNKDIKSAMGNYSVGYQNISGRMFNDKRTYLTLNKKLDVLSMTYNSISTNNPSSSLLVIDSSESSGALLKSITYDFSGTSNSDYLNKIPLDKYNQVPSKDSINIPNFSKESKNNEFEQVIINVSSASSANVKVKFYTLVTPKITEVDDGKVTWSTNELGNIPKDILDGYDIYKDNQKLNFSTISANQLKSEISFENDAIEKGDTLTIVIKDKKGNSWPEVEETEKVLYPYIWVGLQAEDITKPLLTVVGENTSNDIATIVFNNRASKKNLIWKGDSSFEISYDETINSGYSSSNVSSKTTISGKVDLKKNILLSASAHRVTTQGTVIITEDLEVANIPLKDMGLAFGIDITGTEAKKYVTRAKTSIKTETGTQSTGEVNWSNARLYVGFSK